MRVAKCLSLVGALWFASCATANEADNGSKSDWVNCETSNDCRDDETCVERHCQASDDEAEPEPGTTPEPSASDGGSDDDVPAEETDGAATPPDRPTTSATVDEPAGPSEPAVAVPANPSEPAVAVPSVPTEPEDVAVPGPAAQQLADASAPEPDPLLQEPEGNAPVTIADGQTDAGEPPPDESAACGGDAGPCVSYGPAECFIESGSVLFDTCESVLSCDQEVEVNGMVERRAAQVDLFCSTGMAPSNYECTCGVGPNDARFSVVANGTSSACATGATICAQRLHL